MNTHRKLDALLARKNISQKKYARQESQSLHMYVYFVHVD